MAEEPEAKAPKKGSLWSRKFHGVPVPLIAAGGGLALYLVYRWYENRNAASSSTTTPSTTSTGDTTGTDGGYGGVGGGGDNSPPVPNNPPSGYPTTTPITGTPQPVTPGATQVPTGYIVPNVAGGNDQAAVTAVDNAKAALSRAEASKNKTAIKNATANLKKAEAVVAARNSAYLNEVSAGTITASPIPPASKTTPTGIAAQQAPASQALATSEANLKKSEAAEKSNPTAANKAAVAAHQSQVKAGR